MPKKPPIDPLSGPKIVLTGRVVTMDDTYKRINDGALYIENGSFVAVQERAKPPPPGFENVKAVATGGTIFPGLIELHNHLSYNALQLWSVPQKFTNRGQWGGSGRADYRRLVSGPMQVLGDPEFFPSVVRFVECKALLGGVTTSQGIELYSNKGARRYYRGIVRNAEQTYDPELPHAKTKISDVEAKDRAAFLKRLNQGGRLILHLSEGVDAGAREHFLALRGADGTWAINENLVGIHCAALRKADFGVMASRGASMIWSPLSNLLLYGATAKIAGAREEGVRIGLGSDWSPSGSKNLVHELKIARLVSNDGGGIFTDRELVALATREAAAILDWPKLGSLAPTKRADLLVIDGKTGDPYGRLLRSDETALSLVMINGVARFGYPSLMKSLGASGEKVSVGGRERALYLKQDTADPQVGAVTLKQARTKLRRALNRIPQLAKQQADKRLRAPTHRDLVAAREPVWFLALDEIEETGIDVRPRMSLPGSRAATGPRLLAARAAAKPLWEILGPLELDELTVADDEMYVERLKSQMNLPAFLVAAL